LTHNLWVDGEYDYLDLGNDFTADLDIAMLARRNGLPGEKIPKGILTRFEKLTVGRLLSQIETAATPELTGLGLLLLQLSQQTAKFLSNGIDQIARQAKSDGKNHDISIAIDGNRSGITVHCNELPESIARERLTVHCKVRKYDTKANAWYGVLLDPTTRNIRGALVIEKDWEPDTQMDAVMKIWPKKSPVTASQSALTLQKPARNDLCPCGSGKKHKKCCLNKPA
jgi:hypothetical protein